MLPALDRTARDAAYLTLGLLTSVLAFGVWVAALTLSLTLAILIVGMPVIIGSAYVMRWTAELDRQNAALVFGRPVRGAYRSHRGHRSARRVFNTVRDPQVWRDLAWLITHSIVGFALRRRRALAGRERRRHGALPLWYWSIPDGVQFGLWNVDTLPLAFATALLAIPMAFMTVWVMRGMAKLHASLAVELLGRY